VAQRLAALEDELLGQLAVSIVINHLAQDEVLFHERDLDSELVGERLQREPVDI